MDTLIRVTLPQGSLQGCTGIDLDGKSFYKFFGIPYAKPPLGDLRFKAPVPHENWSGVRDAAKEQDLCYSLDEVTKVPCGSEDCLYLNVYTKSVSSKEPLKPVMVWLHGGAFLRGSNSPKIYGPEFLMTKDVVLVTIQYRLGALGFLRLKDNSLEVYGNAGLKDQAMAFKFVKENIRYFGGDPNNITIFGNSAGATSVGYHILSPMSRGLFHKAIMQSGSAIKGYHECQHNPIKMAQIVDENITTEKEALNTLMKLPVAELYEVQVKYLKGLSHLTLDKAFGPVLEDPESKNPFILKNPIDIVTSGDYSHVPIISGNNTKEGMLYDYYRMLTQTEKMTIDSAIPSFLNLEVGSKERKELEQKIRDFYFRNGEYDDNLRDLLGDVSFITPTYATAVNYAKTSKFPVYFYRCSLDTSINYVKHKIIGLNIPGTSHADEFCYMFNNFETEQKLKPGSIEEKCIRTVVDLWTNFATYGNPTPDDKLGVVWQPFTTTCHNFLDIGDNPFSGVNPYKERINFWTEVYRQYSATKNFL